MKTDKTKHETRVRQQYGLPWNIVISKLIQASIVRKKDEKHAKSFGRINKFVFFFTE